MRWFVPFPPISISVPVTVHVLARTIPHHLQIQHLIHNIPPIIRVRIEIKALPRPSARTPSPRARP